MGSYIIHYGTANSGRYPRGSGENPNQHSGRRKALKAAGVVAAVGSMIAITYFNNKMVSNTFKNKDLAKKIIDKNKSTPIKIKKTKSLGSIVKDLANPKSINLKKAGNGYVRGLKNLKKLDPFVADVNLYSK